MIRIYVKLEAHERIKLTSRLNKALGTKAIFDVKTDHDEYIAIPNEGYGASFYEEIENWLHDNKIDYEWMEQNSS